MAQAGYYDESGNWIPGDDQTNPAPPPRPTGTPGNPVYGDTGTNLDPWGHSPGDKDYGYPPGQGPDENYGQTPQPTNPPPPGGGGGGGLSGLAPWTGSFNSPGFNFDLPTLPAFKAPDLPTIPDFQRPAPFVYDKTFVAPTADSIKQDPSFTLRAQMGQGAIENSQAAQGLVRTGGSLKDLIDYNQNFASTEYKNIWDRDLSAYETQRNDAASDYDRTYKQLLDEFDTNRDTKFGLYDKSLAAASTGYQGDLTQYTTQANAAVQAATLKSQQAWDQYLQSYKEYEDNQNAIRWTYDYQKSVAA